MYQKHGYFCFWLCIKIQFMCALLKSFYNMMSILWKYIMIKITLQGCKHIFQFSNTTLIACKLNASYEMPEF